MTDEIKFTEMLKDPDRAARFFLDLGYSRTSVADYLHRQLGMPAGDAGRLAERKAAEKERMDAESRDLLDRAAVASEHDMSINPLGEVFPHGKDEDD